MSGRSRYIIESFRKLFNAAAFVSYGTVSIWNNIVIALQAAHIVHHTVAADQVQQFCIPHVIEFDAAFTNVVCKICFHTLYHIGTYLHT